MIEITRRQAVKGAATLAALGATAAIKPHGAGAAAAARVAIIGAGAGGVMAAYFLAPCLAVDLFEAREKIGGHCDTRVVDYQGQSVTVDVGAQFFAPATHPIYVTLLELVGLYDPLRPDADQTLQAPGSLCIFPAGGATPTFSSTHPLASGLGRALEFGAYDQQARSAVLSSISWDITVEQWVQSLSLTDAFKDAVVLPWLTALIGCSHADALQASARSILQTFALAFPADPLKGSTTYNSTIGLQGNLQWLLDRSPTVQLQLNAPVQGLTRADDGWMLQTPSGQFGPYASVVVNAPPLQSRALFAPLPAFAGLTAILDGYDYFDSHLAIHTDPLYVDANENDWAAYNAEVDGVECGGSVWYGALDGPLASGATVEVFKSWTDRRRSQPTQVLADRWFKHPHITETTLDAARALAPLQGQSGVYFSGVYTNGFDSQESAVYSAMQVAESLAPTSPTLSALNVLLNLRGLSGSSYAL